MIGELAAHGYSLSPGTVYPILHGHMEGGCLVGEKQVVSGKARKYYHITALGRSALAQVRAKAFELINEVE